MSHRHVSARVARECGGFVVRMLLAFPYHTLPTGISLRRAARSTVQRISYKYTSPVLRSNCSSPTAHVSRRSSIAGARGSAAEDSVGDFLHIRVQKGVCLVRIRVVNVERTDGIAST